MPRKDAESNIPEPTLAETTPAEPAVTQSQRKITDSEPLEEKDWAPPAEERHYADAITDEHREHLTEHGMAPQKPKE